MEQSKALQKIEQARLNLCTMKGILTSPEVVKASQELDQYIINFYKEQGYVGHLVPGGKAAGN